MSEPKVRKTRYKTTNWPAYNAALKARGSLTILFDKDMLWYASASGRRGRQQVFSDATSQFCLSIKCLFDLTLRQSLGLVESLLRMANLAWHVPDFSTVSRRQKTLQVQLPYRPNAMALDLLVDSTGIKLLGEGEWKRKKHGAEYRRQWRKVHLAIDASTLEIRATEVTDNSVGDAPMLPELLAQIPPNETLASVSGDGAYDTNGMPCGDSQPRSSGGNSPAQERAAMESQSGRSGYHRRSLLETTMHCFKRLGKRVMARTFHAAWTPNNDACGIRGIAASGVWGISA